MAVSAVLPSSFFCNGTARPVELDYLLLRLPAYVCIRLPDRIYLPNHKYLGMHDPHGCTRGRPRLSTRVLKLTRLELTVELTGSQV